jgi:hypothetical protein
VHIPDASPDVRYYFTPCASGNKALSKTPITARTVLEFKLEFRKYLGKYLPWGIYYVT